MADDRRTNAIDLIAASIVARNVADSIADEREQYPDIGEHDWAAIVSADERMAPMPDPNAVDAAYEYLARRARGQEGTP